jgi:hypothetical protein
LGLIVLHRPILTGAGRFLAPSSDGKAEVVVIEGTQVLKNGAINAGIRLLSNGKSKHRLVVVLHQLSKEDQLFAIQEKYPQFLVDESENIGVERGKIAGGFVIDPKTLKT